MSYNKPRTMPAVIANGTDTSTLVALLDGLMVGIQTPATLTSTSFTFVVCGTPDGTFVPLFDSEGNQVSITVAGSRGYTLTTAEADAIAPWPFAKLVGDQNEAAERTLLVTKK